MKNNKNTTPSFEDEVDEIVKEQKSLRYGATPYDTEHYPNKIPLKTRWKYAFWSALLLIHGTIGIAINEIFIPTKTSGLKIHDTPAKVMYLAILCGCASMISVIVDHYDKRNNEKKYKLFYVQFKYLAWALFFVAIVMSITGVT